jgi:perosamine synthetase
VQGVRAGDADVIPVTRVEIGEEEERLVLEVLRSGQLAQGAMVERLEQAFADMVGVKHAVAVSSGTTALVVAIEAMGLGRGDEIVTSPFTFVATINAILEAGATARFADISLDDFCLDVEALSDAVSPATAAVMPVHLYGQPADMPAVMKVAEAAGAAVIEDAAQAHAATVAGRPAGSFGAGCFSLYATKNITTGEGGIVTTDDDALADRIRLLRGQGMRARYQYEIAGHNYRLTDLQAAVGVPQVARLPEITAARQRNAAALSEGLADVPGLVVPAVLPDRTHVFHQYTVRITGDAALSRDDAVAALQERGIGCGVYYPRPVYDYECYRSHPNVVVEPMPAAEQAAREVLSLPVHPALTPAELDQVVETVRTVLHA